MTNESTRAEGASSQGRSSTVRSTTDSRASSRRVVRTAEASVCGSTGSSEDSCRNTATSSARLCGAGSPLTTTDGISSRRSAKAANSKGTSASTGCADKTRYPRSAASGMAQASRVVFPIPTSPSRMRVRDPLCSKSRNLSMATDSTPRPIGGAALISHPLLSGVFVPASRLKRRASTGSTSTVGRKPTPLLRLQSPPRGLEPEQGGREASPAPPCGTGLRISRQGCHLWAGKAGRAAQIALRLRRATVRRSRTVELITSSSRPRPSREPTGCPGAQVLLSHRIKDGSAATFAALCRCLTACPA